MLLSLGKECKTVIGKQRGRSEWVASLVQVTIELYCHRAHQPLLVFMDRSGQCILPLLGHQILDMF